MNAHVSVRNTAAPTAIAALIGAVAAVFALAASSAPAASKVLLKAATSSAGAIRYVVTTRPTELTPDAEGQLRSEASKRARQGPRNASLGGLEAANLISNCPTVAIGT